jgi:hypothetical protein
MRDFMSNTLMRDLVREEKANLEETMRMRMGMVHNNGMRLPALALVPPRDDIRKMNKLILIWKCVGESAQPNRNHTG